MTEYWLLVDRRVIEAWIDNLFPVEGVRLIGISPWDRNFILARVEDKDAPSAMNETISDFYVDTDFKVHNRRVIIDRNGITMGESGFSDGLS